MWLFGTRWPGNKITASNTTHSGKGSPISITNQENAQSFVICQSYEVNVSAVIIFSQIIPGFCSWHKPIRIIFFLFSFVPYKEILLINNGHLTLYVVYVYVYILHAHMHVHILCVFSPLCVHVDIKCWYLLCSLVITHIFIYLRKNLLLILDLYNLAILTARQLSDILLSLSSQCWY